jgi:type II secretory ATPase GspE/PulE/Tfp pilus assembly ATPase PilB-like protein/ActR/RegA family two-component response regulator
MAAARQQAERDRLPIAETVIALGFAPEAHVYDAVAAAIGTERLHLDPGASSELAVRLVPERLARQLMAVPLQVDNRTLSYATCRPFNPDAERDLAFASGRRTRTFVATRSDVLKALDSCYPRLKAIDVLADRLRAERPSVREMGSSAAHRDSEASVIDMCHHIIGRAVEVGASDVHIESGPDGTAVRFRICGVLEPALTLPGAASAPIRDRFKIMGRVGVAVRNRPQEGAFRLQVNSRPVEVRLSSMPTIDGEKLVLRVMDSQSPLRTIDELGYDAETVQRLHGALARPDGLILLAGPTGSGKTTTLYASLAALRGRRTNVVSVEDPVERMVPGVTQIPVNAQSGSTCPAVLRSLLRQHPEAIMVGEIGDDEVARLVGQSVAAGHLVLSSLPTADPAAAIARLAHLGVDPFRIAEGLTLVVAQRLVRLLCDRCRRAHTEFESRRLGAEHGLPRIPFSTGPGCDACKHTGFQGRVPVVELLLPSNEVRDVISRGAVAREIRSAMRAAGVVTLRARALQLAADGLTSLDEVDRVLPAEDRPHGLAGSRPRVLIADDEPITRMLVKLLLEREQIQVLEAANGRQAVEIAVKEHPDLLVCDLNMPEMDGYEAIARLRRHFALATLPILVLTADDDPGVEQRVLALGADDYLVKPFDAEVLLSRVQAVFRRLKVVAA